MKKKICAAALSLMLLISSGCADNSSSSLPEGSSGQQTDAVTTVTTVSATQTTAAPEMPPMSQPAEVIEKADFKDQVSEMFNGPDNTIVIQTRSVKSNTLYLYDLISGSILRTLEPKVQDEQLIGITSDRAIITTDYNTVSVYPEGKTEPEIILNDLKNVSQISFNPADDCVYRIHSNVSTIFRTDRNKNTTELEFIPENDLTPSLFMRDPMCVIACDYGEAYPKGVRYCVYSFADKKLLATLNEYPSSPINTKDKFLDVEVRVDEEGKMKNIIMVSDHFGNGETSEYEVGFGQIRSTRASNTVLFIDMNQIGSSSERKIRLIDLETNKTAEIECKTISDSNITNCIYNEKIGRWVISAGISDSSGLHTKLVMIDPALAEFSGELTPKKTEPTEFTAPACGTAYKTVREEADKIEKEYGVRILVGDEVNIANNVCFGYEFVSCESSTEDYTEADLRAVRQLGSILSLYPKDFFSHFQTQNGRRGLRFAVVKEIKTESELFVPAGVSSYAGGWYNIAIINTNIDVNDSTAHHEIWHSVEDLTATKHPFRSDEWNALNPLGFEYLNDYDAYMTDHSVHNNTLVYISANDPHNYNSPYFTRDYSLTYDKEDRATLIEQLFNNFYDPDTDKYSLFGVKEMSKYPHLKAKLDYLADWSKQEFGYVYWEKIASVAQ